jgi:hypothetical protein
VGRGIAEGSIEPQHLRLQSNKIHPFQVALRRGASNPEEIKLCSTRTKAEAIYNLTEVDSKYLLEPERIKAVEKLQSN